MSARLLLRTLARLAVLLLGTVALSLAHGGRPVPRAHADAAPQIDLFPLPDRQYFQRGGGITGIVGGPDNAVYFAGLQFCPPFPAQCVNSNNIGRITTDGVLSEFPLSNFTSLPINLALGPDGNIWATGGDANDTAHAGPPFVAKVTPQGISTIYPFGDSCSAPGAVTAGPDGNLWVNDTTSCGTGGDQGTSKVRRVRTDGTFPLPFDLGHPGLLTGITQGPPENGDTGVWFGEYGAIGRIGASGIVSDVILGTTDCASGEITTGPDHNLWFAGACFDNPTTAGIDRMSVLGVVTEFTLPSGSQPGGVVAAPDGKIWFTLGNGFIGSIDPNSPYTSLQTYPVPDQHSAPGPITVGPDGNVWFMDVGARAIGRVTLNPLTVAKVSPAAGPPEGGTTVTITGTGFSTGSGATSFAFGPNAATQVTCNTTVQCTAKTPKGTGAVDVIANVNGFKSSASAGDKFSYSPVTLTIADTNPTVGTPVFFTGDGWNPNGGPIQILYDDHVNQKVVQTIPAVATFSGSTPPTRFNHPTTAIWGCTATVRARQDGLERAVDLQDTRPEAALLVDGLVQAGVPDGTGHLSPVRGLSSPDYICGDETVGVSAASTFVGFQLDVTGIQFAHSHAGTGYAWVNVGSLGASGGFGITFDDDAANSYVTDKMILRAGTSFCLGVYGHRTLAIVLSTQSGAPPSRTQIFSVPAKCDQNIGTTSASRASAAPRAASLPADSAFAPCRVNGLPDVPANLSGGLSAGTYLHHGDLQINQALTLNRATLCVDGNLQLNLGVNGTGTLLVNGSLRISGPIALNGLNGIVADVTGNASIGGVDSTPPITTATPSPAASGSGWFTTPTNVSLAAADDVLGSGVATTYYGLDKPACTPAAPASCTTYAGSPIPVAADGRHTLTYFSSDRAGNIEAAHTLAINIDSVAPATTLSQQSGSCSVNVTLTATDATSGVAYIETRLDSRAWQRYAKPITLQAGHTLQYRAADVAGNVEAAHSFTAAGAARSRCPSPFG